MYWFPDFAAEVTLTVNAGGPPAVGVTYRFLPATAVSGDVTELVDRWFSAWGMPDAGERDRLLAAIAAPELRMEDRFSCFEGLDDLRAHITGMQRFMPGARIERLGAVRRAHWTVLADWKAVGPGGEERGGGTNVFTLNADRKIQSVVGVWNG